MGFSIPLGKHVVQVDVTGPEPVRSDIEAEVYSVVSEALEVDEKAE